MTLEASRNANANAKEDPDSAWAESLREVFRQVVENLPDHATLGELVDAAKSNGAMAPVLDIFTVHELIELAKKRPKPASNGKNGKSKRGEIHYDAEGNPIMDLDEGPKVIRRRADVPDGDARVLRCLLERGPQRESDLTHATRLTADQLRIILRHLRTKGYVHIEGSGAKRRLKITRHGSGFLRNGGA